MKHTKGPWKVITLDGETYINPDRESGEFALIAKIHGQNTAKNSRLIAAAPELLELVENLMELHFEHCPNDYITRDKIYNVLEKVKGKK